MLDLQRRIQRCKVRDLLEHYTQYKLITKRAQKTQDAKEYDVSERQVAVFKEMMGFIYNFKYGGILFLI